MRFALAQILSQAGKLNDNINYHHDLILEASNRSADIIVFPELSITGYFPSRAKNEYFSIDELNKRDFQALADKLKITIVVGAPSAASPTDRYISLFVFQAHRDAILYHKQILHADEIKYFKAGNEQRYFNVKGKSIAPAICYESLQEQHIINAALHKANVYVACVGKSMQNLTKAYEYYSRMAGKYQIPIVMVNSVGQSEGFISAGNSCVWNHKGETVARLDDNQGLLIAKI